VAGATLQRSVPLDTGWGYRARATTDDRYEAGVSFAGPYGNYAIEAARSDGETAARAFVSGGIGWVGGAFFASKTITDSFGVVQVGDLAGIPVYHEGNLVGHTDDNGRVVLPRLFAYMPNRIGIDDTVLPVDASITSREQRVIPFFRSGAAVEFDVRQARSAVLEVRFPDNEPIPTGAEVTSEDGRRFLVGRRGEVFVDELQVNRRFNVRSAGRSCSFVFPGPIPDEIVPKLGPFVCR
jgi:outer membrane usher protein